jgi:hypothetical protein
MEPFLTQVAYDLSGGNVDFDLLLESDLSWSGGVWSAHGFLNLDHIALRHKASHTSIDRLNGSLSFSGRRARAKNLTFRVGSTPASVALDISEINPLRGHYTLRSDNLNLIDFPLLTARSGFMKNVLSSGELTSTGGVRQLRGVVSSSEGTLQGASYRNLETDFAWAPDKLSFKELRMGAFSGELRAGGSWSDTGGESRGLWLMPGLDGVSVKDILQQLAPQFKDRFDGQVDFRGEFGAGAVADGGLWETLKGSGAVVIRQGMIRDFNLIARLFYRGSGQEQNANTNEPLGENVAAILGRADTPVEELRTNIVVEAQRIRTDRLSLLTPEYAITGAGSIGFDGNIQWNGQLAFSPMVTRELQREYGAIRYFLDRKGRLAIAFRLDGKLPNVRVRPENRALAQALRWGAVEHGDAFTSGERAGGRNWLPQSLDRLLHR